MRTGSGMRLATVIVVTGWMALGQAALAQGTGEGGLEPVEGGEAATVDAPAAPAPMPQAEPAPAETAMPPVGMPQVGMPGRGQVTNLPLPRYVTLKTGEGNARRGPGLSHRIDWVFQRAGMPLRVTAEYENWRRVEDQEGFGGWVHYSLLSGVRSVVVVAELADFRSAPDPQAEVVARAERGVVARVQQCLPDWCRISAEGEKGWVIKAALWGVDPGEQID